MQTSLPRLRGDVAIVGMAGLFPGAPTLRAFWQNIVSKVDATSDPPADAWDANIFYDPDSTETDRVYCKRGGFLGPVARFNPLAHGIMPLAVEGGEPDQWLALQLAHDALADAGYIDRPRDGQRTAVIIGKGTYINRGNLSLIQHGLMVEQVIQVLRSLHADWAEADFEAVRAELKASLPPLNTDTASALIPNVIAGRIANRLDLMGPSYTVDGACASSLLAVEIAMRDLLTGQCDMALVGGSQVTTPIPILTLFCQLNALSHQQQLRAFDANADGTVLGEGIGMVVLKRREDAERDGDRIYAVVKGVGSASDGRAVSVMAPRLEGEVLALRRAYEMAGVDPRTVGLIEAHGTGTAVGDAIEAQALSEVFGPRSGEFPRVGLGTVKSMIGHTMPAAGIAGLIKAALALYHKTLPPTLNVETPNPKLGLETSSFYINTETRPWIHGSRETPRRAGVNAFGFGGINAHVVLEEYAPSETAAAPSLHQRWDSEVCIVQAASREALLDRVDALHAYLRSNPDCALKDVAYTLNVATARPWREGQCRLALVASSVEDLQQKLERARQRLSDPACTIIKDVRGIYFAARPLAPGHKVALLFPGEGSQYVNMLADLCIHFPEVRACFDAIDCIYLEHPRNYLPSDVIFPRPGFSKEDRAAAAKRLWQMDTAIEAVLTANHAMHTLLTCLGIQPDVMLGHSTGEYSALRAAGVVDLDDEAVYTRFLQSLNRAYEHEVAQDGVPRAGLLAIGAPRAQVEAIVAEVGEGLHVAMDNCLHQTVVAGEEGAVTRAAALARQRGLIHELLPFDRAYHTPLFAAYNEGIRRVYADLDMRAPAVELYSCTSVGPFPSDSAAIRELVLEHWVRPVEFTKTIEAMYEAGVRVFVESGAKGNLTAFIDDVLGDRPYLAVAANVSRRTGLASLHHMAAQLAVQAVPMDLSYLYARREPQTLPIDGAAEAAPSRPDRSRPLATGWPPMKLSDELTARLRAHASEPAAGRAEMAPARAESTAVDATAPVPPFVAEMVGHEAAVAPQTAASMSTPEPEAASMPTAPPQPAAAAPMPEPAGVANGHNGNNGAVYEAPRAEPAASLAPAMIRRDAGAMHAYLQTMDRFIAAQEQVMQQYVRAARERQAARQGGQVIEGAAYRGEATGNGNHDKGER